MGWMEAIKHLMAECLLIKIYFLTFFCFSSLMSGSTLRVTCPNANGGKR